MMIWPKVEYVEAISIGDKPVTLTPETATNNESIGSTSTPGLCTNGRLSNKNATTIAKR